MCSLARFVPKLAYTEKIIVREFRHLSDAEIAEIRRRGPGVCASLACEGMHLTPEKEALSNNLTASGRRWRNVRPSLSSVAADSFQQRCVGAHYELPEAWPEAVQASRRTGS